MGLLWSLLFGTQLPRFDTISISDPQESAIVLCHRASAAIHSNSLANVVKGYEILRSPWSCKNVFWGNVSEVQETVEVNLERIAREPGFKSFRIQAYNKEFAQLACEFETETTEADPFNFEAQRSSTTCPPSLHPIRLWRGTSKELYVCGNCDFEGGALKPWLTRVKLGSLSVVVAESPSDFADVVKAEKLCALIVHFDSYAQDTEELSTILDQSGLERFRCKYMSNARIYCAKCTCEVTGLFKTLLVSSWLPGAETAIAKNRKQGAARTCEHCGHATGLFVIDGRY